MKRIVLLVMVLGFALALTKVASAGIEEGKRLLLDDKDVVLAHSEFSAAFTANPTGQTEGFWYAVTAISANSDFRSLMQSMDIFDVQNHPLIFDEEGEFKNYRFSPYDDIILDNGDAIYSDPGNWLTLPGSGDFNPYSTDCRYHASGTGTNTATYTFNIPISGQYQTHVWRPLAPENTTSAKYTINHAYGSSVMCVNQKDGKTGWSGISSYCFNAGPNTIVLSDESPSGRVVADAIRLYYGGANIEDGGAGFSTVGTWSVYPSGGHGNSSYHYHSPTAGDTATWSLGIPVTGRYLLQVYIPKMGERTHEAVYTINTGAAQYSFTLSQAGYYGEWAPIGTYDFNSAEVNTVTVASSAEGIVVADAIKFTLIRDMPSLAEIQATTTSVLTELDDAISKLSNIDEVNKNFFDIITPTVYPDLDEDLYLDYADAKALEGSVYSQKALYNIMAVYNMDSAGLDSVFGAGYEIFWLLDNFQNMLTPASGADEKLAAAKIALENAITCYMAASDYIRNTRPDDSRKHLVRIYENYDSGRWENYEEWQYYKEECLRNEELVRDFLNDVYNNLQNPSDLIEIPAFFFENSYGSLEGVGINIEMDLDAFFSSPKNIHTYMDAIAKDDIVLDSLPADTQTLGEILVGFTSADWNSLLGNGIEEIKELMITWNNNVPSVVLQWDPSKDPHQANIVKYEIYRSDLADPNEAEQNMTRIAEITNPSTLTYTDSTIGGEDIYYYRLYTYYNFGNGETASTYTDLERVIIKLYVNANASYLGDPDGSKAKPFTDLGDAVRGSHRVRKGTKVCVAGGTYNESSYTMWLYRGPILEGGYNPADWSRNITGNETIITAAGLEGDVICAARINEFVIDGFTLTGCHRGQYLYNAINIYCSNNVTIRNCKIIDNECSSGIFVGENSSAVIENCYIYNNGYQSGPSSYWGYGINIYGSGSASGNIKNCIIMSNKSYGINATQNVSLQVFNNLIKDHTYGGVYINSPIAGNISNNTIVNNGSSQGSGIYLSSNTATVIKNNIITGHARGIYATSASIDYNDVYGNTNNYHGGCSAGAHDISSDALFVDAANNNFHLSQVLSGQASNSPCVDAGSASAESLGFDYKYTTRTDLMADTGIVDIGFHYYNDSSALWALNMIEMNWYENALPYSSTGAASAQMILNYIREGAGVSLLTQNEIYEYARGMASGISSSGNTVLGPPTFSDLTPVELDKVLGHFDPYDSLVSNWADSYDSNPSGNPYQGYNYDIDTYNPATDPLAMNHYMRDICHWMAYTVTKEDWWKGGELVARPNTPAAIPIYGTYDHWVTVKGCVTSQHPCPNPHTNPYNTPDFAVYGFWIKDPLVTGIGQNTYKTADECQTTYFQPLVTSDSYNGLFLQIAEPPAAPSDASVEVQVPIPDIGNLIFIGADTTSFSYSGSKQASSIMQASAITGYPTRSYSFNKKSWKDIVDPSILLDPEAVSCFEGTSMGKPILVQRIDKANADYYLVPFGRRDKRLGFIANAVVVLDSKMGYFKEASWTNIAEKFLKVEEKDAKCLVRRYLIKERLAALRQLYNDMINSIRRNPKQAAQFRRIYQLSVSRLHQQYAQLLKYLTSKCAKLLWRPGEYSKTPYRPYWQISAGTKVFYVTQEGKVYLGSKAKSIF